MIMHKKFYKHIKYSLTIFGLQSFIAGANLQASDYTAAAPAIRNTNSAAQMGIPLSVSQTQTVLSEDRWLSQKQILDLIKEDSAAKVSSSKDSNLPALQRAIIEAEKEALELQLQLAEKKALALRLQLEAHNNLALSEQQSSATSSNTSNDDADYLQDLEAAIALSAAEAAEQAEEESKAAEAAEKAEEESKAAAEAEKAEEESKAAEAAAKAEEERRAAEEAAKAEEKRRAAEEAAAERRAAEEAAQAAAREQTLKGMATNTIINFLSHKEGASHSPAPTIRATRNTFRSALNGLATNTPDCSTLVSRLFDNPHFHSYIKEVSTPKNKREYVGSAHAVVSKLCDKLTAQGVPRPAGSKAKLKAHLSRICAR